MKKVLAGLGVVITLATLVGIYHAFDKKIAWAEDVKAIAQEVKQNRINFDKYVIMQTIRDLKSQQNNIKLNQGVPNEAALSSEWRHQYQCLQLEIDKQTKILENLK